MIKNNYTDLFDTPPVNRKDLELFYKTSDKYLEELNSHDEKYLKSYIDFVSRYLKDNQMILDLGCGNGRSTYLLGKKKEGLSAIGCDLSFKFLNSHFDFKRGNIKYAVANAVDLPFENEEIDVVCCFQLIEHMVEIDNVLCEIARVLKKGGTIIIVSPNLLSPFPPVRAALGGKEVYQNLYLSLKNIFITLDKIKSGEPKFLFRKPELAEDDLGHDLDSVYMANQIDIKRFFQKKGFKIINVAMGMSFAGRILARLFPDFSGEIAIVAKKVI